MASGSPFPSPSLGNVKRNYVIFPIFPNAFSCSQASVANNQDFLDKQIRKDDTFHVIPDISAEKKRANTDQQTL
jgi:hypothetical protein